MVSVVEAIKAFLNNLEGNTRKAYEYDFMNQSSGFLAVILPYGLKPSDPIKSLSERHGVQWVQVMWNNKNKSTISRRVSAFKNLLRFCKYAYRLEASVDQFSEMLKAAKLNPKSKNRRKVPVEKIETILSYVRSPITSVYDNAEDKLRALRDRAFIVTLADTGLRVSEACSLKRGDIMYETKTAVIVGKGSKTAVIRFSSRSILSIRTYLNERSQVDGTTGKPLSTLPLFAQLVSKKIKPISSQTGRAIVDDMAKEALGPDYVDGEISPHSLRHYFVIMALKFTGGDLKKVKELARHDSILTTELYTQMEDAILNQSYREIFDQEPEESPI